MKTEKKENITFLYCTKSVNAYIYSIISLPSQNPCWVLIHNFFESPMFMSTTWVYLERHTSTYNCFDTLIPCRQQISNHLPQRAFHKQCLKKSTFFKVTLIAKHSTISNLSTCSNYKFCAGSTNNQTQTK